MADIINRPEASQSAWRVYTNGDFSTIKASNIYHQIFQEIHPACPKSRLILHNALCLDLLESKCKTVHLF